MKNKVILFLGFLVYRILAWTCRTRFVNPEILKLAKESSDCGGMIYGLWHEDFLIASMTHTHQGIMPLISLSRDGEIITRICNRLGYRVIRGSSSRGGKEAREQLYAELQKGGVAAITGDGPRGPRRKLKSGAIDLPRRTGVAVVPLSCHMDRYWTLSRTWDKTRVPKPFSKVAVVYGNPFFVESDLHGDAFFDKRDQLEKEMIDHADRVHRGEFF